LAQIDDAAAEDDASVVLALHDDLCDVNVRSAGERLDDPAAKRDVRQITSVVHQVPEPLAKCLDVLARAAPSTAVSPLPIVREMCSSTLSVSSSSQRRQAGLQQRARSRAQRPRGPCSAR
jgi:hypothetical protein